METSFTDVQAQDEEAAAGAFNPVSGDTTADSATQLPAVPPGNESNGTGSQLADPAGLADTGIQGEVRRQDVNIPKLTLVNALSKARTEGDATLGAFLFADEVKLCAPNKGDKKGPPLDVFVLGLQKRYMQKLPMGSAVRPLIADTADEVRRLGGTLTPKKEPSKLAFEDTANILLLVPAPEGADESDLAYFRHEFEGRRFAKCLFFVKSYAYTNVAKPLFTWVNNTGRPLVDVKWSLHSEYVEGEQFKWWTPKLTRVGLNDAALVEFLHTKRN